MSGFKPIDSRQVENRSILQELAPWLPNQSTDVLLSSANQDLTPPFKIDAQNPVSLTVNIGPSSVANSVSGRNKSASFLGTNIPVFTSGTVTFPAASGGNITTSTGGSTLLTLPSGDYVQVLLSIDQSNKLNVAIGTPNPTLADALVPSPQGSVQPFGYVTLQNVGGVIQNITQANCYQFYGSGAGSGGSGTGTKNYLSSYTASTSGGVPNTGNGNAESGSTIGWSLGTIGTLTNGLPTGSPTFGSGASGNLSFAVVSGGSQLAGNYSFSYASSAATTQGNMVASDPFFIDAEDQAKVLAVSVSYSVPVNPTNGNFSGSSSNSFGLAVYDVTNSAFLPVAGAFSMVQNSGGSGIANGTIQTALTTTELRFIVYNVNATSGAITLYLDDIFVGPQVSVNAPAISDWVPYTPTFTGFGTVTGITFFSRRVGDSLQVTGWFSSGTSSATLASVSVGYNGSNANVTIDSTKMATYNVVGNAAANFSGSNYYIMFYNSGNIYFGQQNGTNWSLEPIGGSTIMSSGQIMSVNFQVPISGWSSNSVASNDTDTRVVAAVIYQTSPNSISSGSDNTLSNLAAADDTHGAFSSSTNSYRFPVSGYYSLYSQVLFSSTGTAFVAGPVFYINGVSQNENRSLNSTTDRTGHPAFLVSKVNAGDILTWEVWQDSGSNLNTVSGQTNTYFTISRLSGPATINATESVNAAYYTTSGMSVSSGSTQTLGGAVGWTNEFDSHNMFNPSTGFYTAPISGKYQVIFCCGWATSFSTTELQNNIACSSGVVKSTVFQGTTFDNTPVIGIFNVLAGQTFNFSVIQASGSNQTTNTGQQESYFAITRIGN